MGRLSYGYELILDLHGCDTDKFCRRHIDLYFKQLCKLIGMTRCERYWWDDVDVPTHKRQTSPHTQGTSAVQFILTSSIVIHTLDQLGQVFINIFSCKPFNPGDAQAFTEQFFKAKKCRNVFLTRG